MKINELENIYMIFDNEDDGYEYWFGTQDDIVEYLEENKKDISKYDKKKGWIYNLEQYGLTFKIIN
jgi:hypothetical protein